jgi:hypothetical protein
MSFLEFVEALARVAEKLSPSSPTYKEKNLNAKKRRVLPLFIKFEGLTFILYQLLKSQFYKEYGSNDKVFAFDKKVAVESIL